MSKKETKIGIIADIHMRNNSKEKLENQLIYVVEELKKDKIDLLVILGDIIEHEASSQEDKQNIKTVKNILNKLDCPKRYIAGNHDSMNLSNEELSKILGNELYGKEKVNENKLIFLNTSSPWLSGARGEVTNQQLSFLDKELAATDKAILFVHHPIHYHNVQGTYWWHNYPERAFCANKKEINDIIDRHGNIELVINGHLHEDNIKSYKGSKHITLNAFGKEIPWRPVVGNYSVLRISEDIELVEKTGETVEDTYKI